MELAQAIADPRSPAVTPGVQRLPVLNGLTSVRFFAALHVALYHLVRPIARWGFLAAAIGAGYSGVSFFFFLSGFILTYSHANEYEAGRGNLKKFFIARFARIYPVYLVSMIAAGFVYAEQFRSPIHIVAYVADLLLVQAWSMRMINFFNTNAWTLSCEAFFYLVFPFVLLAIRPKTRIHAIAWVAVFFALAMAGPLAAIRLFPIPSWSEPFTPTPGDGLVFLISRLPAFALPEFLAGMSVGWLFLKFKPSVNASAILAALGVLLLGLALLFADHLPFLALHNGLLLPLYAMVVLGLSQPNWITRLLSGSALILLGEASYAFYLIHAIFNTLERSFGFGGTIREACISLPVIIGLSVLMHLYIERPARRYVLAWWAKRNPRQMQVV
jgi:peptidoglycan/LPS O-acetylase OafA/YrhL